MILGRIKGEEIERIDLKFATQEGHILDGKRRCRELHPKR